MFKRFKENKKAKEQVAADNEYYAERGETEEIEDSKRMVIIKAKFNKLPAKDQKFILRITEEYKPKKVRHLKENINKAKLLLIVCIITIVPFLLWGGKLLKKVRDAKKELEVFGTKYMRNNDFDDLLQVAYYDEWKYPHRDELRTTIGKGEY